MSFLSPLGARQDRFLWMSRAHLLPSLRFPSSLPPPPGNDWDPTCMKMDETLYSVQEKVQNFAVIYLVDITKVPDFNKVSSRSLRPRRERADPSSLGLFPSTRCTRVSLLHPPATLFPSPKLTRPPFLPRNGSKSTILARPCSSTGSSPLSSIPPPYLPADRPPLRL